VRVCLGLEEPIKAVRKAQNLLKIKTHYSDSISAHYSYLLASECFMANFFVVKPGGKVITIKFHNLEEFSEKTEG
jgi:hypothetical protein